MDKKLLTLKEVADNLRVSQRSVFRYIHQGQLKATKVGKWRIDPADLKIFMDKRTNTKKK